MNATYESELYHFGVKGMKWGVRRYQNADGSLTAAGKKKYGKQYQKLMAKSQKRFHKQNPEMKSYNDAVNYMNKTGIDLYNDISKPTDANYMEGYADNFNKVYGTYHNKRVLNHMETDKYARKGHELAKKYSLYKTDSLAKDNKEVYDKLVKNYRNMKITITDPKGNKTTWATTGLSEDQIKRAKQAGYKFEY